MFGWIERKVNEKMEQWDRNETRELMPGVDEEFGSHTDDEESLEWFRNKAVGYFGEKEVEEAMPNVAAWRRITK